MTIGIGSSLNFLHIIGIGIEIEVGQCKHHNTEPMVMVC